MKVWWGGGAWQVCDALRVSAAQRAPVGAPACCRAIPVIQGRVPEAVTAEISLSKY